VQLHSSRVSTFLPVHTVNCMQTLKVLNMTALVGSAVFASKPYFLDADPIYLENVTGYYPREYERAFPRDLFDTVIDVEPITGAVRCSSLSGNQPPLAPNHHRGSTVLFPL
jgi:hypothetical protein